MLHVVTTGAHYPPEVTTWKILTNGPSYLTAGPLCTGVVVSHPSKAGFTIPTPAFPLASCASMGNWAIIVNSPDRRGCLACRAPLRGKNGNDANIVNEREGRLLFFS